jgi:hypothetical protein
LHEWCSHRLKAPEPSSKGEDHGKRESPIRSRVRRFDVSTALADSEVQSFLRARASEMHATPVPFSPAWPAPSGETTQPSGVLAIHSEHRARCEWTSSRNQPTSRPDSTGARHFLDPQQEQQLVSWSHIVVWRDWRRSCRLRQQILRVLPFHVSVDMLIGAIEHRWSLLKRLWPHDEVVICQRESGG